MPKEWPAKVKARVQRMKKVVGEDGTGHVESPTAPSTTARCSRTWTPCTPSSSPTGYYRDLISFALERSLPYTQALDDAGVDVHCVGGNVPSGFLGKKIYDEHILSWEKKYISFVQKNGTPAMYHNCGQIMALVESYRELGVRVVEPFSPAPSETQTSRRPSGGAAGPTPSSRGSTR